MNCMYRTLLAAVALAFSSVTASAETITVCASGCDYTSINAAIGAASGGDVIQLAAETYFEGEQIDTLGKAITLRGVLDKAGEPASVLDGAGTHRVLRCQGGESAKTVFESLVIQNGYSSIKGGGMYNSSSPTLTNCTFTSNSARSGGGMYNDSSSSPTLTNCTFTSNSASLDGGGMFSPSSGGSPSFIDCVFTGNSADNGGGLQISNSSLSGCEFSENLASSGGGIHCGENVILSNCVFDRNTAERGGGMWGSAILNGCQFTMNTAELGGACWARSGSSLFHECSITNNAAIESGGGIYLLAVVGSELLFGDCVFESNTSQRGAAVSIERDDSQIPSDGDRTFEDSTVRGNLSMYGGAVYVSGAPNVFFRNTRVTENEAFVSSGGIVGVGTNVHLMDTVVCGNDREEISSLWTDGGGNCISDDCEPCEEPFNPCPTDLDQNGITDGGDLGAFFIFWGECQVEDCLADFNDDEVVDGIDLGILFSAWGPCQ